jgi:PQQ-dependent dehydrogenase (methanol/ethanol family)
MTKYRVRALVGGLSLLVLAGLVLSACGGSSGSSSTSESTEAPSTSTEPASSEPAAAVEPEAEPSTSWTTVGGDLQSQRESSAEQVTPENVTELKLAYRTKLDGEVTSAGKVYNKAKEEYEEPEGEGGESNPLEADGIVYAVSSSTEPTIGAYEAATGKMIWQKSSKELGIPLRTKKSNSAVRSRGLAIGGGMLYDDQPGGILIAMDQETGKVAWRALVNTQSATGLSQQTPVYDDGLVFIGQSGGDFLGVANGFIKAFDAKTGQLKWTFRTAPKPGEPAASTWGDEEELKSYGAAVWTNVTVDPELELVYIPVGNPFPDVGLRKPGKDLYSDSIVAVDLKTGKLKWYYQTTHHDVWDSDCVQPPVLWDQEVDGEPVKGMTFACKSGYQFELNRETGKPTTPVKEEPLSNAKSNPEAKEFDESIGWQLEGGKPLTEPIPVDGAGEVVPHCASKSYWSKQKSPDGNPIETACAYNYYSKNQYVAGQNEHSIDWWPTSYNEELGYAYYCGQDAIRALKWQDVYGKQKETYGIFHQMNEEIPEEPPTGRVTAIDVKTNKTVWQHVYPTAVECTGGSVSTTTGLVFTANSEGQIMAYDGKTGKIIWTFEHPGIEELEGPPIIFEEGGTEYVVFQATVGKEAELLVFSLNGEASWPVTKEEKKEEEEPAGGKAVSGMEVFTTNCGSCHTLAAAGTTGSVGPNLDEAKPSQSKVENQVKSGGTIMPAFQNKLSEEEITKVSEYVSESAGKGGSSE